MKKIDGLGRSLNAAEQKLVMGGKVVACTCNGSGSAMDTVGCSFGSLGGYLNCVAGAASYCTSHYGGSTTCDIPVN